ALTLYKGVLSSDRITNTYLRYQEVTGSNKFQKQLKEWYEKKIKPVLNKNINIPNSLVVTDCDYPEFAYRDDADNFDFYDGPEVPDLVKGYKISKNLDILQLAMKIAQKRLSLGNYIIRDGWEHGCNTRRFLHGKGNDAAQTLYTGTGVGKIHYFKHDETPGLPEEVAVLCRENNESYNLYFYNQDQKGKKMKVVIRKEGFHNKSIIKKGKLEEKLVKKAQMVELKPAEITEIKINK
ncbi:MAG: hypothetical protein ACOC1S_05000, partial [bacterium]